jgi:hypothetical protein
MYVDEEVFDANSEVLIHTIGQSLVWEISSVWRE